MRMRHHGRTTIRLWCLVFLLDNMSEISEEMSKKIRRGIRRGGNLIRADLRKANLSWKDLSGARLNEADLRWATKRGTSQQCADPTGRRWSGALVSS